MLSILFVEDDKLLNETTKKYLEDHDFQVVSTFNGLDALKAFEEQTFDIILSDIMMPLCDGFELLKEIRRNNQEIPFIFISARDDKPSKMLGYKNGVDDYITKPFDLDELVFKINAVSRRLNIQKNKNIEIGNFKMDQEEHMAYINDEELALSVREFDVLFKMLSYPKKTFTRSKLMEEFWGFDSSATSRTVDVYMAKLREKTKSCDSFEIQTVHGLGYKVVLK